MTIKKAIIIGALCAMGASLTAYAIKKGIDIKPKTMTAVNADDVETANGNWYFNNTLTNQTPNGFDMMDTTFQDDYIETYHLILNNNQNGILSFYYDSNDEESVMTTYQQTTTNPIYWYINEDNSNLNNTYKIQKYRAIKITGGTDTTNPHLINWLKQNATKLPDTIQNTSWKINNEITAESAYGQFAINFYSNGFKYNTLKIGYYANSIDTPSGKANAFMFNNSYNVYDNGTWEHQRQWSRITITDGTDTTNYLLISWLFQNAEQMQFISNPVNTKWVFENVINTISISDNIYNIQFTTRRTQSFYMRVGRSTNTIDYAIKTYNETTPYNVENVYNSYWLNTNYQTIIITGTDESIQNAVTDMYLIISFLQSNANGTSYTPIPTGINDYDIEDGNFTSIQSLMLRILTMPFTFIVQAFNVTLWPNTAWEFNIGNFIVAIIAISAVLFIIKVFTSGFSVIGNYTSHRNQNKLTKSQIETNKTSAELNRAKTEKVKKETK